MIKVRLLDHNSFKQRSNNHHRSNACQHEIEYMVWLVNTKLYALPASAVQFFLIAGKNEAKTSRKAFGQLD